MSYQVLARKWRPQVFDDVVGQDHVTTPLRNAIRMDRVPHAILLTGPRGCGKILNYMAMGLTTVTFETPVSREYLGPLGTFAGRTGDPAALADSIAGLLDDPQRRAELGQKLRERAARHFSWERTGRQLLNIYRTVLAQK